MAQTFTVPGTDSVRLTPIYPEGEGARYDDVLFDFDEDDERLSLIIRNGELAVQTHFTKKEADYLFRRLCSQFGYVTRKMRWPGTVHVCGLDLDEQENFEGNEDGVEFTFEFSPYYGKSRVEFFAEFVLARAEAAMFLQWLSVRLGWDLSPPLETQGELGKVPFPVRVNEECEGYRHLHVVE